LRQKLLLCITGSISAYKTAELLRLLVKEDYSVTTVVSDSATKFVCPFLLQNLSNTPCYTEKDFWCENNLHINLARGHDALIIVPASANTLSKCSLGFADSLITNIYLAFEGPVLMCPAMHSEMYTHSAIQISIKKLIEQGVFIFGPEYGELASNHIGNGRLADLTSIVEIIPALFLAPLRLENKRILITSGGCIERIDPVRFISNQSSGRLGKQLSLLALLYKAKTSFITSKVVTDCGYETLRFFESSDDLYRETHDLLPSSDVLIMAAAVSDFKAKYSDKKLKRHSDSVSLELESTRDILQSLSKNKSKKLFIGFNLSNDDELEKESIRKVKEKNCDYIIGNTAKNLGADLRSYSIYTQESCILKKEATSLSEMAYDILSLI